MANATVVRIRDVAGSAPVIDVIGAPFGYNIYVGPLVTNPEIEQGALINLLGLDQAGNVPDGGWRFVDPGLSPGSSRNALHIIWVTHDHSGPLCNGDLQIGYNSVLPGHYYANPAHTQDQDLGAPQRDWVTIYSGETLVLQFKKEPVPCGCNSDHSAWRLNEALFSNARLPSPSDVALGRGTPDA
jgi:hypothetical protein